MVSVAHDCTALEHFGSSGIYAVNILREDQLDLSIRFSDLPEGRFEGVSWHPGIMGAPVLDNVLAVLECRMDRAVDVGDHQVLIGEVVDIAVNEGRPLIFFGSGYTRLR